MADVDALRVVPGKPLSGELAGEGELSLPGDKSLSHRAALLGAMAEGVSQVDNFLLAGVTQAILDGLNKLGVEWQLQGRRLRVQGLGLAPAADRARLGAPQIDCGSSATSMRLLAGALAAWGLPATLDGSPGLRRRPMGRIVEPLTQMGVPIQSSDGGAPLLIGRSPRPLRALDHTLSVASAQVKSCLLLAALAGDGETVLREPGPSRDHTERMLRAMGVEVHSQEQWLFMGEVGQQHRYYLTRLTPPQRLQPLQLSLPGDISAAAFLIVAALITPGSRLILRRVGLNPTRTGLLEALRLMGADLVIRPTGEQSGEPLGDMIVRHSQLRGAEVKGELVVRMIDEFPAFAVAAAYAEGLTVVSQAEELRFKESDRITALGQELGRLGVDFKEMPDGFHIRGGLPLSGGVVNSHGDHRLAMALAAAGLAAKAEVVVGGAGIITQSYPEFAATLRALGADVHGE
ncbi:MAG: 3-phosphoshikimate 1-carboxyvinyltransferase [Anaerolineales bacterium]|nr:3-phosphoshikimate 1-carboxyvinyltransferase [Anaerolineales bacterium]